MVRVCRRVAAIALAGLALAAVHGGAAAGPAGRLVIAGECPSRAQAEAALAGVVVVADRGEWTIAIAADGSGARMTLRDRRGQVALQRRVDSRDCAATARAFAVILHAYFRRLAGAGSGVPARAALRRRRASRAVGVTGAVPQAAPSPRAEASPSPVVGGGGLSDRSGAPSDRSAGPDRSSAPPDRSSAPSDRSSAPPDRSDAPSARSDGRRATTARREVAVSSRTRQPSPRETARPTEPAPARRVARTVPAGDGRVAAPATFASVRSTSAPSLSVSSAAALATGPGPGIDLALTAGGTLAEPTGAAAFALLDIGWRFGRRASLRLQASAATPTVQDQRAPVELQHSALAAGLGYQLGGRVWLRPAILTGASAWRIDPLDIEGDSRLRVQPIAAAVLATGVRLGRAVSLRADVGLTTFLRNDRFLVPPAGEVARSPRTQLAIGAGIEWASFH